MRPIRKATLFTLFTLLFAAAAPTAVYAQQQQPFTVYGYIVYPEASGSQIMQQHLPNLAAPSYGIHPINLVYEERLLDVDKQHPNDTKINTKKIDAIAKEALSHPKDLVALDMESWKRFDVEHTPALYEEVLKEFHKVNPESPVSLYGIVPQVTYGWRADLPEKYDHVNAAYKPVADQVGFFSPSLYNWDHALDAEDWARAAEFAFKASREFDPSKPIIPYITPEVVRGDQTTFLSYDQMLFRLQTLQKLGASGCIIWTGTAKGRKAGGTFDPQQGWGKAVVDFTHASAAK